MAKKALTEEEKIRRLKLRMLTKKQERLGAIPFASDEDKKIKCPVCSKEITETDIDTVEYIKTKRSSEIFVHTECVSKWSRW